jgi:TPR repeat protein
LLRNVRESADPARDDAAFFLALMYERGLAVKANAAIAKDFLLEAQRMRGFYTKLHPLYPNRNVVEGICYKRGYGDSKQDLSIAIACFRRDEKRSAYQLAQCYDLGRGVAKDVAEALQRYRLYSTWDSFAARRETRQYERRTSGLRHELAPDLVSLLVRVSLAEDRMRTEPEVDDEEWIAAQSGDEKAQHAMGLRFQEGKWHTPKNPAEAFRWFIAAAVRGLPTAQSAVAACYDDGAGCAVDKKQAYHWASKAAAQNDPRGLYLTGEHGVGTSVDLKSALSSYERAVQAGSHSARVPLASFLVFGVETKADVLAPFSFFDRYRRPRTPPSRASDPDPNVCADGH